MIQGINKYRDKYATSYSLTVRCFPVWKRRTDYSTLLYFSGLLPSVMAMVTARTWIQLLVVALCCFSILRANTPGARMTLTSKALNYGNHLTLYLSVIVCYTHL